MSDYSSMTLLVESVTTILSALTVLADVGIVLLLILLFTKPNASVLQYISKHALLLGFLVSLGATVASIFYASVAGFIPCTLCWWARILTFPQVVIFGIALLKRDRAAIDYGLALSSLGLLVSGYHTYLQFGGMPLGNCAATSISCSKLYFLNFGYVSIPTMALTVFLMLFTLMLAAKRTSRINA